MAESSTEVGLITHVNGCMVHIWLMNVGEEKVFRTLTEETLSSKFQLGTWLCLSKNDLKTLQIRQIVPLAVAPIKAWTTCSGSKKFVQVEARIILPPVEWAYKNDYEWFAYSIEFGRVGNFAFHKLLERNGCKLERDTVYKAVLQRIPPNETGQHVTDVFGAVWTIPPQVLVTCNELDSADKRPWRSPSSGYVSRSGSSCSNNVNDVAVCGALKDNNYNSSLNESIDEVFQPLASSNDYMEAAAGPSGKNHCGHCYQPGVYQGVVILREPQYSIVWGKVHGYVAVSATAELVLGQSNWVEYDCIETDTELGVRYLAIYCTLSARRPLVVEPQGNSIICHTVLHLPNGRKSRADPERTHFTMMCDILGEVLVPDIPLVNRCVRKDELRAQVRVEYDINAKWPCKLFAVLENGTLQKINWEEAERESEVAAENVPRSDLDISLCRNGDPLVSNGSVLEVPEAQKKLKKRIKPILIHDDEPVLKKEDKPVIAFEDMPGPSKVVYPTSHSMRKKTVVQEENFDWLQRKQYSTDSRIVTLPVTVLVKLTPSYGIIWHIKHKLIVVPAEHLGNNTQLGTWMKAKVSTLHTHILDLPYRFITVRPVEKIATKLMTRRIGNIIQARVCLEPGADIFVMEDGKTYLQRNSELGHILIPPDRLPHGCETKRFRAWVTFMSSGMCGIPTWMFTRRQRLVEVDQDGNELPEQFDTPVRLTEETSNEEDDVEIGNSSEEDEDEDDAEDGEDEEFYDCLSPSD